MFTYLGLRNFRAFEGASIQLAPLTVFVGPNNAGKSSIVSALRILAQTALSEDFRIPLLLNGPMGDFGTHRDIVYQNKRGRSIGISIGWVVSPGSHRAGRESQPREARLDLNFAYRTQRREVILQDSSLSDQSGQNVFSSKFSPDSETHLVKLAVPTSPAANGTRLERRVRLIHFLVPIWEVVAYQRRRSKTQESASFRDAISFSGGAFETLFKGLRSIEYLGPFRGMPKRTVLFSGERPARLGMDGGKAVNLLALDYLRKGRSKKRLSNQIINWFKSVEMASDLKVRVLSDRHFEMLIQHPATREFENLADVGYGVSQVLPILAAGYNMESGSTLIVEEPEIHLHPRAQAGLGDFFAGLYKNGVQCVLETHSEHLIVRLQKHVATGFLKASDILVYYVHAPSASKEIFKLRLRDDGMFADEWPRGFFEDRLEEATALARASQG